jgi:hypothetical protein
MKRAKLRISSKLFGIKKESSSLLKEVLRCFASEECWEKMMFWGKGNWTGRVLGV